MFFVILGSVLHYSKCENGQIEGILFFQMQCFKISQQHTQNESRITIQNKIVFFSIIQAAWWKNCDWGHLLEGAHFVS